LLPLFTILFIVGSGVVDFGMAQSEPAGPARVLVIGDSHLNGTFGLELHKQLRTSEGGPDVTVVGSCGRWSKGWVEGHRAHCGLRWIEGEGDVRWGQGCKRNPCAKGDKSCREQPCRTPEITQLLADQNPDVTVVQLGGNSLFRGSRKDRWKNVEPWVDAVAQAIVDSGSRCLWVTPPHGLNKSPRKMDRFRDFLRSTTAGRCAVFDSGPRALPWLDYGKTADAAKVLAGKQDRIHYDRLGRVGRQRMRRWARLVATDAGRLLEPAGPLEVLVGFMDLADRTGDTM
jgi:hypothetical protein